MKAFITRAGFLATVQDLGRIGLRDQGVAVSGALDPFALRVANALVGNDQHAAGLELTVGHLALNVEDERIVAWCGGDFDVRIDDAPLPPGHAALLSATQQLTATAPQPSSRAWIAISGGIDVPPVLGSRSTDLRAAFGGHSGRALRDGDVLPLGELSSLAHAIWHNLAAARVSAWAAQPHWTQAATRPPFLAIVRGPDWNDFPTRAHDALVHEPFTVSPDSNRMGARLRGPRLEATDRRERVSEAVTPGTLQVPPDGHPILLLNDCQTIGGYPKIAHVISVDLCVAALLRAGDIVRFHEVALAQAQASLRVREEEFAMFRVGIELRAR
ncbi:MAG: biotin-dependent carboxyltransferase family protein [Chthoniobacterales bacterium]